MRLVALFYCIIAMRVIKIIICLVFSVSSFISCSKDDNDNKHPTTPNANANIPTADIPEEIVRLEFPKVKNGNSIVLVHKTNDQYGVNYSTEWDTRLSAQRWSCYQMYDSNSGGHVGRYDTSNGYPNDELLPHDYQLIPDPYYGSGFDHGHICPSADRQYSKEANRQTFFLTNMQPQFKEFNQVDYPWEQMEEQVRSWNMSSFRDTLYVVKGGTIDNGNILQYLSRGSVRIPVPKFFFVAILCKNATGYKALGFWFEHKKYKKKRRLGDYITNIDQLEELTGIDFFCNLPDNIEEHVESQHTDNIKRAWGLK